ncbi:gamma-glutamyl-gamma-aminobutyrate hydrolase family protein [Romboutsia weinsteinii]|uniref:Gamma-glutamyl-gamma-aminobutyrate hydrolase family protein n=1 Tax=Romboutsia weinsteinii TaxID=2020949 RepID=A0A371J2W2_9FIRM|nr:gamma-glutamyl-gamma-aminobutyrate hydrolase family protein [Romboutsia weinsteinii]RDY27017.1 gamma-glutamyl-gamma-aminobutyrate hydrolase family protein [Romboutsia weinsteinii]
MKPFVGILGNIMTMKEEGFVGQERGYLNNTYINAVEKANGVPIIIPVTTNEENIRAQISKMDGILLSGGVDVDPILYNEEPREKLGTVNPTLDEFNLIAIKIALELNKPILGICRGLQVLNIVLGGTLYQDLDYIDGSYIKHVQNSKPYSATHSIKVDDSSVLKEILGENVYVNSYHHQSIKDLGNGLRAIAYSCDGIIEAVEKIDSNFVIGVQWHPESMVNHCDKMLNLFRYFVNSCE